MSDIYKVAVRLTMESNVAGVLAQLSRQILHVHSDVKNLEGGFARLNRVKLAVFGGLSIAGGTGLLDLVKSTVDAAKDLNKQLTATGILSANPAQSAAMQAQALSVARATTNAVRGVTLDRSVEVYNESVSFLGADNAARVNLPLNEYAKISGAASGDYDKAYDSIRELLKAGEMTGRIMGDDHKVNLDKLIGYLDLASKVTAATAGRVNAKTFFQVAQQGSTALRGMDDDGLLGMLMATQQMGGFRVGTSAMSLFSQFAGGKMTEPVAHRLKDLGLVGGYHQTGRGGALSWDKGALDTPFIRELAKDPLVAIKSLREALTKHGVEGDEAQVKELFKILGRQTTQRLVTDFMLGQENMVAERGRIKGAQGLEQQNATLDAQSYDANLHSLTEAWKNLREEMGNPMMKSAIGVLHSLTDGLRFLDSEVVKIGPDNVRKIGEGIAILGGVMIGAGGLALLAAIGPGGWLVAGLGALVAVAGKGVAADFVKLDSALNTFFGAVKGTAGKLVLEIETWPSRLGSAISKMGSDIVSAIGGALGGIFSRLNPFKKTSFDVGGVGGAGGGGLYKASYGTPVDGTGSGLFDAIMTAEGTKKAGYDSVFGNGVYGLPSQPVSTMTLAQAYAYGRVLSRRNGRNTSALGAFQIEGSTMRDAARALGYDWNSTTFDAAHQQAMAAWIAKRQGLGAWEGFKSHPDQLARARHAGIPKAAKKDLTIHVPVHLDGKVLARVVTKRQTQMAMMPGSISGGPDDYGSYVGPGTTFQPA